MHFFINLNNSKLVTKCEESILEFKKKIFFHHFQFMLQILQAIYLYPPRISVWPDRSIFDTHFKIFLSFLKNVHSMCFDGKISVHTDSKLLKFSPFIWPKHLHVLFISPSFKITLLSGPYQTFKNTTFIFWVLLKILIVQLNNKNWWKFANIHAKYFQILSLFLL